MGASKTAHYSDEQNLIATIFKALGHPARITILEYLLQIENCICGDIVQELKLSQSTVSQHLRELKNVGLIKGNIEGNAICYCVDMDKIQQLQNYFEALSIQIKTKSDCCN